MLIQRRLGLGVMVVLAVLALLVPPAPAKAAETVPYIAPSFRAYYVNYSGFRSLGYPIKAVERTDTVTSQYFEKARIEDHSRAGVQGPWAIMYGRLTAELIEQRSTSAVNSSNVTYAGLALLGDPAGRQPAPEGFTQGTLSGPDGTFIPVDPQLGYATGYTVPRGFWDYMNRADIFPGGWLHDLGLPMTPPFQAQVFKNGEQRSIVMQAFERNILSYDALNPAEWQIEKANTGTDYLMATGVMTTPPTLNIAATRWIEVSIGKQWVYAYEAGKLVMDAPTSTGRDGWDTPLGQYAVYAKVKKQTMRGSMKGETWEVPDVPNILYFNGDVALHGTYWHNRFGSGARLSHGCVNLPLDKAAWLFDWASVGTPVQVYR
jgi:lipoprotein-anchoring transpeptidase ErfK/SrfK